MTLIDYPLVTVDHKSFVPSAPHMRIWDRSIPFTVKVDGQSIPSGFAVERPCGRLVFETETQGVQVTVSGAYLPSAVALLAEDYFLCMGGGLSYAPRYGDQAMRRVVTESIYAGELRDIRLTNCRVPEGQNSIVLLGMDGIRIWAELNPDDIDQFRAARTDKWKRIGWIGKRDADKRTAAKL